MVDYIIVATSITLQEAIEITQNGGFKEQKMRSTGFKTAEYKDYGVTEISVWADTRKVFTVSKDVWNCFYSATIDANAFQQGYHSYEEVLEILMSHVPATVTRKAELEWKVKAVSFVYNFKGVHIKQYYTMLRSGYDLSNLNMMKKTEKIAVSSKECYRMTFTGKGKKSRKNKVEIQAADDEEVVVDKKKRKYPKKKYRESMNIEVTLDYNKTYIGPDIEYVENRPIKNRLQIKVKCKKIKTIQLCTDYGIKDRDFLQFIEQLDKMDCDIFKNYIGRIGGSGIYYRYVDAEAKVMSADVTPGKKQKMCDAMKGVALYKGISNYLSHVEDEPPIYECMKSMRKRSYAVEALNQLQKLNINPITISVHRKLIVGETGLPNLFDVYEAGRTTDAAERRRKSLTPVAVAVPVPVDATMSQAGTSNIQGMMNVPVIDTPDKPF